MNVLDTIRNRTSLRVFQEKMVALEDLEQILEAATLAPTAGNQQLYSIIVIKNEDTKKKLAESCDHQPFIAKAPLLLLFVSDQKKWFDYYRLKGCKEFAARENNLEWEEPNESDLLLSIEDTMIAAHSAVLMAESLGIGSCYIGDILENYEYHKELFRLPDYVVPISLVCFGYYKEDYHKVHRKRFDQKYVVFDEIYHELSDEELEDMFANRSKEFVKSDISSAENFAQAFYRRKTGAAFSKEMKRSVRKMLKDYVKYSE